MKAALIGGTFNPIHNAHIAIARTVIEQLKLDVVYFVPTALPPHKLHRCDIISIENRVEMLLAAISEYPYFEYLDYEIRPKAPNYTVETVKKFLADYPEYSDNLHYIVGEDNYYQLDCWKDIAELSDLCTFVVLGRDTEINRVTPLLSREPILIDAEKIDISSSEIRELVNRGAEISDYVPKIVADYISDHSLYL